MTASVPNWHVALGAWVALALVGVSPARATETVDGEVPEITPPLVASLRTGEAANPGGDVELVLRIEAAVDLPNVTVRWTVPRHVAIVHGSIRRELGELAAGAPVELRLVVRPLAGEEREVVVGVVSDLGHGNTVAASAVYSLDPDEVAPGRLDPAAAGAPDTSPSNVLERPAPLP